MSSVDEFAGRIAASALPITDVEYGPWEGSIESIPADRVPRSHVVGGSSSDFLYLPRTGAWKRRGGQTIKYDTLSGSSEVTGLMPSKWSGKGRQIEEFISDSVTDGVPTVCALVTKETVASGLDDGRFGQLWWRDLVNSTNRTIGSEFSTTLYPATPGSPSYFMVTPLWHQSGDGSHTRLTTEYLRRLVLSGSRRFLKVGKWWYFPNLLGTPCRWNGTVAAPSGSSAVPSSDITSFGTDWGVNGGDGGGASPFGTTYQNVNTNDGSVSYMNRSPVVGTYNYRMGLSASLTSGTYYITYWAKRLFGTAIANHSLTFDLYVANGDRLTTGTINVTGLTDSWVAYTVPCNTLFSTGNVGNLNSINVNDVVTTSPTGYLAITYIEVNQGPPSGSSYNRLMPTGPIPPTHSGSLAAGNVLDGSAASHTVYPISDVTIGAWRKRVLNSSGVVVTYPTNLYQALAPHLGNINEQSVYISGANDTYEAMLGALGFTPDAASNMSLTITAKGTAGAGTATAYLYQGASLKKTMTITRDTTPTETFSISSAEINSITDWADLRIRIVTASTDATQSWFFQRVQMDYSPPTTATEGAWLGKDRFMYATAYRFEDGSVWMPSTPRLPSGTHPTGFNIFTVNGTSANAESQYDFIQWSNIPIGPFGTISRILLRTPKIDSTITGEELKLNPFDLRVITELNDNTTTTYRDSIADDFALAEDSAGLFIRYDHIMPPRARYIAGGDMRIIHGYGSRNPCAITFAPVGRAADYDLNLLDTSSTLCTSPGLYYRLIIDDTASANARYLLVLYKADGSTASQTFTIDLETYTTLQQVVDKINSSSFASNGQQWRAQLCPGANPEAPSSTCLTPTVKKFSTNCTTASSSTTLTLSAGGLSTIGVGTFISGTNITAGTYVTAIVSDTTLTMSAVATGTGSTALTFYADTGDTAVTSGLGYVRAFSNSRPSFLYFNQSYLDDDPVDKSSVWMTVGTPGSSRSAANLWSGQNSNRFRPPANAGIFMGGAAVDLGFVLAFSGSIYALRDNSNVTSGVDQDYKLSAINENRGCCAWNTVVPGNRFVPYLTAEGLCAADLSTEILLSEAIFLHSPATGGLSYEIPLCVAATGADNDSAYASAKVMNSAIWLNYRASGSTPNRQVVYDFSSGSDSNGLRSLVRTPGKPWGWSTPLIRSLTAMGQGRTSTGSSLYGWKDSNAGATGDGRIDEFETGSQDNGTDISAVVATPWERNGQHYMISAQELVIDHKAPSGATIGLDFHRSYGDVTYTLTVNTTTQVVLREVKMLPQAARVVTAACYMAYRQSAGSATELRKLVLRLKQVPSYK